MSFFSCPVPNLCPPPQLHLSTAKALGFHDFLVCSIVLSSHFLGELFLKRVLLNLREQLINSATALFCFCQWTRPSNRLNNLHAALFPSGSYYIVDANLISFAQWLVIDRKEKRVPRIFTIMLGLTSIRILRSNLGQNTVTASSS